MQSIDKGHLVRTSDGYYAIVVSIVTHTVFLSNGLEQDLKLDEWNALQLMPMHVFSEGDAPANFLELIEGRSPYQIKQRGELGVRRC